MKTTRFPSSIERLESRIALTSPPIFTLIREATGANAAAIQATVDEFRADLGGPVNGNAVGSLGAGRREITWDGADNDSAPARLPADFFNAVAPRGVVFGGDPRITFQQSADGTNATGAPVEFGNINATYPAAFGTFSTPRLFTSLTSNVIELRFVIPGTDQPAAVTGFGAVFTDVDTAGSTRIELLDIHGAVIVDDNGIAASRNVPATPGDASLSFLGIKMHAPIVGGVRIISGNAVVGPNDVTQGGTADIVVMDDFIYGEPQPVAIADIAHRQLRVFGDNGANKISVSTTAKTGTATIDGVKYIFNAFQFDSILVRSEGGDDIVKVTGKPGALTIESGAGNDNVAGTSTGAARVTAGAGNDVVKFTGKATSLFIDGGDDNDTISAGALGQVVVLGGNGNDILKITAAPAGSAVDGGAGDDLITGGSKRDILVGGVGLDTIKGGSGEDVLIAGGLSTGLSFTEPQLRTMLEVWAEPALQMSTRIAILQTVLVPFLTDTFLADTEADKLTGGGGLDWFLAAAQAEVQGKLATGEVFTPIT